MKVFLVNTNKAWGGGEKWHFETALTLQREGFEVAMICASGFELFNRCLDAGIQTTGITSGNLGFLNLFRMNRLVRMFKSGRPDLVILNLSSDLKTSGIAAKLAGIRNIIYRRGNAKPVKNSILNRFLFQKVITGVIANSEETRKSILVNNPRLFPSEKIRVLYNGINLESYDRAEIGKVYKEKDSRVILGSAGRLSHEKGHHLLIEAVALLNDSGLPFTLLIAGDGPELGHLAEKCRESGIDNRVVFTGFITNIKSFMETIDIFVLPSLWEGFGYVTIEAMASRKPVIAFKTGSNPEIIEDGSTGCMINCYDTHELAEKIKILSVNKQLREEMGAAGRKRAENMFSSVKSEKALLEYLRLFN